MILSNAVNHHPLDIYCERAKLALFFQNSDEFDLYGSGWQGYPNWRGDLKTSLFPVLQKYRFSIAYENTRDLPGFITERIFNAFFCGCVPVYWGASNITDYVPKECFIDRREFSSNEDLYRFMKSIDRKTYDSYLEEAKQYLSTPKAKLFSPRHFAKTIMNRLFQAYRNAS
jgi:hypothetical protein